MSLMDTKACIFTRGYHGHQKQYKFCTEKKKKKKKKKSVSFMPLFAIIKLLPTLRLSRQTTNFFSCHFASV